MLTLTVLLAFYLVAGKYGPVSSTEMFLENYVTQILP